MIKPIDKNKIKISFYNFIPILLFWVINLILRYLGLITPQLMQLAFVSSFFFAPNTKFDYKNIADWVLLLVLSIFYIVIIQSI